ncbi:MAG: hypothetical protein ACTSYC_05065 [Promethearchaeota archaeon]
MSRLQVAVLGTIFWMPVPKYPALNVEILKVGWYKYLIKACSKSLSRSVLIPTFFFKFFQANSVNYVFNHC